MSEPEVPAGQSGQPALDADTVADLRGLQVEYANPQFLQQLVQIFVANAPRRIEQIRIALATGDARLLEHTAHTLKSNCAMLGASRMASYCHDLETRGADGTLDAANAVFAIAESEFARVLEAVGKLVDARPGDKPLPE